MILCAIDAFILLHHYAICIISSNLIYGVTVEYVACCQVDHKLYSRI